VIARDAEGEAVVQTLDLAGVAASTGSACTTGSTEPSHVLTALGYPDEEARGSLRLTLGRTTTDDEIEQAARIVPERIVRTREAAIALAVDPLGEQVGA
jgi:cysteine desulfurase